jgi:Glycosyl transferase family 2
MTMKIAAGIVVYADVEGLDRCLSTLGIGQGGLDGAIIIHRRYDHFSLQDPTSLPETKRVARKYANVFVHHSDEPITQVQARNLYMEFAGQLGYDWLLVIDSDEFVMPNADWKEFRRQLEYVISLKLEHQIFDVEFEGSISERGPRPRLFLRPGTIRYHVKHYWWVLPERGNMLLKGMGDAGRIITGINLYHGKSIRTMKHITASMRYYQWQEVIEQPFETPDKLAEYERNLRHLQEVEDGLTPKHN